MDDRRRHWLRLIEAALLALGVVCLGYVGYAKLEAHAFQREQAEVIRRLLESPKPPPGGGASDLIGIVEIPRLKVSSPVLSGDDSKTLAVAVGHLPDTPKPWERGNSALSAHRDGLFRPLKNIRVGDEVHIRSVRGDFTYRVRDTKIVTPDDLSVLAPFDADMLTLITCYPFNFVGNAPKRFIVHAERVPSVPATAALAGARDARPKPR